MAICGCILSMPKSPFCIAGYWLMTNTDQTKHMKKVTLTKQQCFDLLEGWNCLRSALPLVRVGRRLTVDMHDYDRRQANKAHRILKGIRKQVGPTH
jgi:hypothetical protein